MAKKTTRTVRKATKKSTPRTAAKKPSTTSTGQRTITPYLAVNHAAGAIDWYKKTWGAKVVMTKPAPGGKIMHAELKVGDSSFFLSDIFPQSDLVDPTRFGSTVTIELWTKNVDKLWQNAVANGAKVTMPLADQFWGDRYGRIVDPFGHSWGLAHKSKLSKKELDTMRDAAMKQFGQ